MIVYIPLLSFTQPPTTAIYTLSLHDALPIWLGPLGRPHRRDHRNEHLRRVRSDESAGGQVRVHHRAHRRHCPRPTRPRRSEEHTSELQSRQYLVCRLLLEKKKTNSAIAARPN